MIDGHAHICDPVFDEDRQAVLERARQAGVTAIIAVGENLLDAVKNLVLARTHPMLKPAAGLYPAILDMQEAEALFALIRQNRSRLAGIGEVGLDYRVVTGDREKARQREILCQFIALSRELDLPLNVHSRSAGRHAVALLLENDAEKVQMHAFDGKASAALPAVEAGYFFSIPPSVVRSRQKQKLVKQLPLSAILVETDSPVLGPEAGVRNEPANLMVSIRAISQIKGVPVEDVVQAARRNAQQLYGF